MHRHRVALVLWGVYGADTATVALAVGTPTTAILSTLGYAYIVHTPDDTP